MSDQHHYFATHAMGYVTAETKEAAIEKLLLKNTDPSWNRNCLKDGVFLTFFVCRVPVAQSEHYKIEWYIPQVDGLTECENHIVTYLTKTKYAECRDPQDEIKKRTRKYDELAEAIREFKSYDRPEVRAILGDSEEDGS